MSLNGYGTECHQARNIEKDVPMWGTEAGRLQVERLPGIVGEKAQESEVGKSGGPRTPRSGMRNRSRI